MAPGRALAPRRRLPSRRPRRPFRPPKSSRALAPFRVSCPPNPRPRAPLPPISRLVQFRRAVPSTGLDCPVSDLFSDTFGTKSYHSLSIRTLSLWTHSSDDDHSFASLSVSTISPADRNNPISVHSSYSRFRSQRACLRLVYPSTMLGQYKSSEYFAKIQSSSNQVIIEVYALFF